MIDQSEKVEKIKLIIEALRALTEPSDENTRSRLRTKLIVELDTL